MDGRVDTGWDVSKFEANPEPAPEAPFPLSDFQPDYTLPPATLAEPSERSLGHIEPKQKFGDAFVKARQSGLKEFEWGGKRYSTETREEAAIRVGGKAKPVSDKPAAAPADDGWSLAAFGVQEPSAVDAPGALYSPKTTQERVEAARRAVPVPELTKELGFKAAAKQYTHDVNRAASEEFVSARAEELLREQPYLKPETAKALAVREAMGGGKADIIEDRDMATQRGIDAGRRQEDMGIGDAIVSGTGKLTDAAKITGSYALGTEALAGAISDAMKSGPQDLSATAFGAQLQDVGSSMTLDKSAREKLGGFVDIGNAILSNPKGFTHFISEQAPNFAAMTAGNLIGWVTGGPAGARAGQAVSEFPLEFGSQLQDRVGKSLNGREATRENVLAALNENPNMVRQALTKAIGTTFIDSVTTVAGQKVAADVAAASAVKARRALGNEASASDIAYFVVRDLARNPMTMTKAVGNGMAVDTSGAAASEIIPQKVAYGEVDAADVIGETLLEPVFGSVGIAGAAVAAGRQAATTNFDADVMAGLLDNSIRGAEFAPLPDAGIGQDGPGQADYEAAMRQAFGGATQPGATTAPDAVSLAPTQVAPPPPSGPVTAALQEAMPTMPPAAAEQPWRNQSFSDLLAQDAADPLVRPENMLPVEDAEPMPEMPAASADQDWAPMPAMPSMPDGQEWTPMPASPEMAEDQPLETNDIEWANQLPVDAAENAEPESGILSDQSQADAEPQDDWLNRFISEDTGTEEAASDPVFSAAFNDLPDEPGLIANQEADAPPESSVEPGVMAEAPHDNIATDDTAPAESEVFVSGVDGFDDDELLRQAEAAATNDKGDPDASTEMAAFGREGQSDQPQGSQADRGTGGRSESTAGDRHAGRTESSVGTAVSVGDALPGSAALAEEAVYPAEEATIEAQEIGGDTQTRSGYSVFSPSITSISVNQETDGIGSGDTTIINQFDPVEEKREIGDIATPPIPNTEAATTLEAALRGTGNPAIDLAAHAAASSPLNAVPEPTEAQKKAGNYAVGRVRLHGMDISIENPAGSIRSGTDSDGERWETEMQSHYGYIRNSTGRDKDHIDVFLSQGADTARTAWVIDQINQDGTFDEHKIVIGPDTEAEARDAYLANYDSGWMGLGAITPMAMDDFKTWVFDKKKTRKPVAYKKPSTRLTAHDDPRIAQYADTLRELASQTGWAQTGGRIYRNPDTGEVDGRTAWIPNAEWYPNLSESLSGGDAVSAVEAAISGASMSVRQKRFVSDLLDVAESYANVDTEDHDPDSAAEAAAERAAIQATEDLIVEMDDSDLDALIDAAWNAEPTERRELSDEEIDELFGAPSEEAPGTASAEGAVTVGQDEGDNRGSDSDGTAGDAEEVAQPVKDDKTKWIKAVADKNRLNGSSGVQINATPDGKLTFNGDPRSTKDGKSLLGAYEEAKKAGATDDEILQAIGVKPAISGQKDLPPGKPAALTEDELGKLFDEAASEVDAEAKPVDFKSALDAEHENGFDSGNSAVVRTKQDLEKDYGRLTDGQIDELRSAYQDGVNVSNEVEGIKDVTPEVATQGSKVQRADDAGSKGGSAEPGNQEQEGFRLEAETAEQVKAEEDRLAAIKEQEAYDRAIDNAMGDTFMLTGSNRVADELAARGQGDLLGGNQPVKAVTEGGKQAEQPKDVAKEPWEMSYDEYLDTFDAEGREFEGSRATEHRASVQKAVNEGKMSADAASRDYPDIASEARLNRAPARLAKIIESTRGVTDAEIDNSGNNIIKRFSGELKKLFGGEKMTLKEVGAVMNQFNDILRPFDLGMQIGPDFNPKGQVEYFNTIRSKVAAVIESVYREVLYVPTNGNGDLLKPTNPSKISREPASKPATSTETPAGQPAATTETTPPTPLPVSAPAGVAQLVADRETPVDDTQASQNEETSRQRAEERYKEIISTWGSKSYGKTWKPTTPLEIKVEAESLRAILTNTTGAAHVSPEVVTPTDAGQGNQPQGREAPSGTGQAGRQAADNRDTRGLDAGAGPAGVVSSAGQERAALKQPVAMPYTSAVNYAKQSANSGIYYDVLPHPTQPGKFYVKATTKDAQLQIPAKDTATVQAPQPAAKPEEKKVRPSDNLITRIKQLGGINTRYRSDVLSDNKGGPVGLFSNTGKGLDDLATELQAEGFDIDIADVDGGVESLTTLVQDAIAGRTVLNFQGQGAATQADQTHAYRQQLIADIEKMGGTARRNAQTKRLEEQRAALQTELNLKGQLAAAEAEKILGNVLTDADWNAILELPLAELDALDFEIAAQHEVEHGRTTEEEADYWRGRQETRGSPVESAEGSTRQSAEAGRTEPRTQEPQALALTGQTPEEVKAEEARLAAIKEQEAYDRAIDNAMGDTFILTGSKRAADELAARGQGDIFSQPSATRSKPKTRISFDGITGPTGAKLTGYEWAWKPYAYVDRLGEDREGRESDWDNAETNVETGRDIVHKFTVAQAGNEQTVSLETALQLLGFAEAGSLSVKGVANTAKRVAKIKMAIAELEPVADAYDKAKAEVDAIPHPEVVDDGSGWKRMGTAKVRWMKDSDDAERMRVLKDAWRNDRMNERGFKSYAKTPHQVIAELNDKLARAERKLADSIKAAQSEGSNPPAKVVTEGGKQAEAKEPWQMTREMYSAHLNDAFKYETPSRNALDYLVKNGAIGSGGAITVTGKQIKNAAQKYEIFESDLKKLDTIYGAVTKLDGVDQYFVAKRDMVTSMNHRGKVESALLSGKPVPAEVLDDYPDLQSKQQTKAVNNELTTGWKKEGEQGRIEDFGEKLGGARKDLAEAMAKEYSDDEIASLPLSKVWPTTEVDAIEDKYIAAVAFASRQEVPAKPRVAYKVAAWVNKIKAYRGFMRDLVNGKISVEKHREQLKKWKPLEGFYAKVTLLENIDRDQWKRIGKVSEHPDSYTYDADGNKVPVPQVLVDIDGRRERFVGTGTISEVIDKVNEKLGGEVEAKRMQFEVRGLEGAYFINKAGDSLYRKLKTFGTTKEAIEYRNSHYDDLVAAWDAVKASDNVKETDVRRPENRPRTAKDWRNGKDATPEQFEDGFGFRGVEFGNWVSQGKNPKERQGMLNQAYDALMDLSNIVGVPPKAMSLNGSLGLGFGSRGHGWASAHFEPNTLVINLTKTRGAGALAHEWFHAMDNYFQRERIAKGETSKRLSDGHSGDFITYAPENYYVNTTQNNSQKIPEREFARMVKHNPARFSDMSKWKLIEGVRPEVGEAFSDLVKALNDSPMAKRASLIDKGKSGGYWSRIIERGARSFENYVIHKMMLKGYSNDYLANVTSIEDFARDAGRYPYLLEGEIQPVADAFDNLFATIKTKETDKGVAMFSRAQWYSPLAKAIQTAKQDTMPAQQWKLWLLGNKAKLGLKDDEIQLSGITDYLDLRGKDKVTKAEIADYFGNKSIRPNEGIALFQRVWHGTPHLWNPEPGFPHGRPRLDKQGTGEGGGVPGAGAAYGYGFYSAEAKEVGASYRNTLAGRDGTPEGYAAHILATYNGSIEKARKYLTDILPPKGETTFNGESRELVQGAIDALDSGEYKKADNGSLYQLDIPDDVLPYLLDWDKPLSQQTAEVRKALAKAGVVDFDKNIGPSATGEVRDLGWAKNVGSLRGEEIYKRIVQGNFGKASEVTSSARKGSEKAASEYLASIGIVGNRYLDVQSRKEGEGSYNYVLWDQATLDKVALLERNGEKLNAIREAQMSRGAGKGMALRDLKAVATRVKVANRNMPEIHVYESPASLDLSDPVQKRLYDYIEAAGAMNDVEGATHEGEIYAFASNLADEARAEHVLTIHELTHYGLRGVFGSGLDPILQSIWLQNPSLQLKAAQARKTLGLASNVEAIEEVLADLTPAELVKLKGWRKLVQFIRDWFREHGFTATADKLDNLIQFGMDDQAKADLLVADVVNAARDWVKNGKRMGFAADGTNLSATRSGTITVDGVERPRTNSNGKPIAVTDEGLRNFWRWFSPSPGQLLDGLSVAEVSSLKRDTEALADFIESQSGFPEPDRFKVIPSSVFSHVTGVVNNDKILDTVVRSLPVDVVNFLRGKQGTAKDALHDAAMLKKVFSVYPAPNVALGVNPSGIAELLVRVVANTGAKITGLTNGTFERNTAVLADASDPVLGAHVRKSPSGDLGIISGFGDSKVVDDQGRPLVVYHGRNAGSYNPNADQSEALKKEANDIEKEMRDAFGKDENGYRTQLYPTHPKYAEMISLRRKSEETRQKWFVDADLDGAAFDPSRSGDVGVHFTPDPSVASTFGKDGAVFPVYLKADVFGRVGDVFSRYQSLVDAVDEFERLGALDKADADRFRKKAEKLDAKDYRDERDWGASNGVVNFWNDLNAVLMRSENAGFVYRNDVEGGGDSYVVFAATQIKSAIGNSSKFDPTTPNISLSRRGQSPLAAPSLPSPAVANKLKRIGQASKLKNFVIPPETGFRQQQRIFQDSMNRFTVIQDWLAEQGVADLPYGLMDVYRAEERMHGKIASRIEDFREKRLTPLIKRIHKAGFEMAQIAEYLHANHAVERNEQIERINKAAVDVNGDRNGSGMTDAEAAAVLSTYQALPNFSEFEALAEEVRSITDSTKRILLGAGIISQDQADAWDAAYKHYVPLRGNDEGGTASGKGLSVNAKSEHKRAMGHGDRESGEWIVENIIHAHERAIYLAEKNVVGKHLLTLAASVPNADLWTVSKPAKRGVIMPGQVAFAVAYKGNVVASFNTKAEAESFVNQSVMSNTARAKSNYTVNRTVGDPQVVYMASGQLADNEVQVYVKGHAVRIQLIDPLLANAYKRLGQENLTGIMALGRDINNFLSRAYTGLAPEFIVTNVQRDLLSGMVNILGEEGATVAARSLKNWPEAMYRMSRFSVTGNGDPWFNSYRESGGSTGGAYIGDLDRIGREVQATYDEAIGVFRMFRENRTGKASLLAAKKLLHIFTFWIEHMNAAAEGGMRLAAYRAKIETEAKRLGVTADVLRDEKSLRATVARNRAASLAKNSTVNFNRKGEKGAEINANFLFYNATVQGSAITAHALAKGKHKGQAWTAVVTLTGLAVLLASQFGDDEWEEIPQHEKDRNMLIKLGDTGYVAKYSVPYGHGLAFAMGNSLHDLLQGKAAGAVGYHMASAVFENLMPRNPLGEDAKSLEDYGWTNFVPEGAFLGVKWWSNIGINRDGFGRQIMPESKYDETQPDHLKMYSTLQGSIYDKITSSTNKATGGTDTQAGSVDVSPETLQFLFESITGGLGRFAVDEANVAKLAAQGSAPEVKEVPVVRKFARERNRASDARSEFWETLGKAEDYIANRTRAVKGNDSAALERMERGHADLSKKVNEFKDAATAIRDSINQKRDDDTLSAAKRREAIHEIETGSVETFRKMRHRLDDEMDLLKE